MNYIFVWLMALIVLIAVEIATMGLTTIWFAAGAVAALFLALAGVSVYLQMAMFLVISIVLLICTRPLAVRFFNQKRERTNVDGMIGKQAIVLEKIDNLKGEGQVSYNGMEWSARSCEDEVILLPGTVVEIMEIQGVKLIVRNRKPQDRS